METVAVVEPDAGHSERNHRHAAQRLLALGVLAIATVSQAGRSA